MLVYQCVGCGGRTVGPLKDGKRCGCGLHYMPIEKPPLGLMPRKIHDERRLHDVANAINRYIAHGYEIPTEWVEEYNGLVNRIREG